MVLDIMMAGQDIFFREMMKLWKLDLAGSLHPSQDPQLQ